MRLYDLILATIPLSALLTTSVAADDWRLAGYEGNHRIAIDLETMPAIAGGLRRVVSLAVPSRKHLGRVSYTLWFSDYDCDARTRQRRTAIIYSNSHDPRRTDYDAAPIEPAARNPAIANQLEVICASETSRRTSREGYPSIRAFVEAAH